MLTDHKLYQERSTQMRRDRRRQSSAYGRFIASLAPWDWFMNPLTFRDRCFQVKPRRRGEPLRVGLFAICGPDPRLIEDDASSRYEGGPPAPELAISRIEDWFAEIQDAACKAIGWVIAEEYGRIGGRWHCHALLTGVSHLNRQQYRAQACQRFGYTRIERFDPERGAAYYSAKYEGRFPGGIHFGGTLKGVDLSKCPESRSGGGHDVVRSDFLPGSLFYKCLPRRHR